MRTMLADFKLALCVNEDLRQLREAMQKESIGDQHQFTVVPVLSRELNVLQDRRIKQRFTAEQCESRRLKSMGPLQVLGLCVGERWQLACQVKIAVVAALLTGQIATMSNVVLKSGQVEALHRRPP
jgi:hypothetical protein